MSVPYGTGTMTQLVPQVVQGVVFDIKIKTGRLYCMTCFLQGIKVKKIQIKNIQSHRGQVFLKDEDRTKYSGSVYKPYKEVCYYDEQNSFICYGDYIIPIMNCIIKTKFPIISFSLLVIFRTS